MPERKDHRVWVVTKFCIDVGAESMWDAEDCAFNITHEVFEEYFGRAGQVSIEVNGTLREDA